MEWARSGKSVGARSQRKCWPILGRPDTTGASTGARDSGRGGLRPGLRGAAEHGRQRCGEDPCLGGGVAGAAPQAQPEEHPRPLRMTAQRDDVTWMAEGFHPPDPGDDSCPALSEEQHAALKKTAMSEIRDMTQGLPRRPQTLLCELCCAPDSLLSSTCRQLYGNHSAVRMSDWNGCDMNTPVGVTLACRLVKHHRPKVLWISSDCGPFSPLQNLSKQQPQHVRPASTRNRIRPKTCITTACRWHAMLGTWAWKWCGNGHNAARHGHFPCTSSSLRSCTCTLAIVTDAK